MRRKLAETYRPGDTLRFHQANKTLGIAAQAYATVKSIDAANNRITVDLGKGKEITYDPRRAYGVSIFESKQIALALGERLQFTSPFRLFSNRDMGTVAGLDRKGNLRVEMDDGRLAQWNLKDNSCIDYAYSSTSHSIQGATLDRTLLNVEMMNSHVQALLDKSFTYVGSSRLRQELKWYVDNKVELEEKLNRVHEKHTSLSSEETLAYGFSVRREHEPETALKISAA